MSFEDETESIVGEDHPYPFLPFQEPFHRLDIGETLTEPDASCVLSNYESEELSCEGPIGESSKPGNPERFIGRGGKALMWMGGSEPQDYLRPLSVVEKEVAAGLKNHWRRQRL
jgi:hypothetical protein